MPFASLSSVWVSPQLATLGGSLQWLITPCVRVQRLWSGAYWHDILILFIHSTHKQSWRRGVNRRGHKPSGFLCSDCGLPRKVVDSRGLFQKRERIWQLFGRCQAIKVWPQCKKLGAGGGGEGEWALRQLGNMMLKAWDLYCHQLCLIQQVSWVSKSFLEKAPCHAGQEVQKQPKCCTLIPTLGPVSSFSQTSHPRQLLCLPGKNRLHHLSGSEPTLSPLAAPASPSAQADPAPRRADSLPRRLRCPRRARPSRRTPAGSASVCLQPRPLRAALQPGHRRLSARSAPPRTATASP